MRMGGHVPAEGERVGRFVVLRDQEGRRHAVATASVSAVCEVDDGVVLLMAGDGCSRWSRAWPRSWNGWGVADEAPEPNPIRLSSPDGGDANRGQITSFSDRAQRRDVPVPRSAPCSDADRCSREIDHRAAA